ncbi:MAG: 30S ribosomal protein S9 [Candidatus Woesearchaeota archaeon]
MKVIITSGKRKNAIARAKLTDGQGIIRVNSVLLDNYHPLMLKSKIMEPLDLAADVVDKVNISVKVSGGGISSQAEAIRLAIARALVEYNNKLEKVYLNYDRQLLVADVRRKEVCKPNDSKARAKRQKSYR